MKVIAFLLIFTLSFLKGYSRVIIINGLTHTHNVTKGSINDGKIILKNDGLKAARVIVYKQDLVMNCQTNFDYQDESQHERSLKSWLKTNVDEKILEPNEEYSINYTIEVPNELNSEGTFWGTIMIENADILIETKTEGVQIGSKIRYAVNILADIGSYNNPKLTFESIEFKNSDSTTKILTTKLKNHGNFACRTKITLEVYSDSGQKLKTLESLYRRVFPERCNDFEIPIKEFPKGKYNGVVVADNGKDLFGVNVTILVE